MAHDEHLATRLRAALGHEHVTERKMFGGLCFLVDGHMCCGITGNDMMLRVGPDAYAEALLLPYARPMDFTGKPLKGFLYVAPAGLPDEITLHTWLALALSFLATLPRRNGAGGPTRPVGQRRKSPKPIP